MKATALVFTAGPLIPAAVEERLNEAHEAAHDAQISAGFFIGGFALFSFVASDFEA